MKKITVLSLILALLTMTAGAALAESAPLLYEVKDAEGHVLYLLGTIHVGGEDMYPLSDAVWSAYEAADVLAVEMDVVDYASNVQASLRTMAQLIYTDDSAENHLSPETYALGVEKLGMPEAVLRMMRPAAWYSLAENYMIQAVGLDAEKGVDYCLLERAHADHKRIDELEGMDEQLETLLNLPEDVLDQEIQIILTYPEQAGLAVKLLYYAWCQGNEQLLVTLLSAQDSLEGSYDEFSDVLVENRNEVFEQQAVAYLQSGETVLVAIGALHILGEDGLAARLAQAGYEVNEIGR